MDEKYEIDTLDRKIINYLLKDARMPFLEIARKLIVSGGTIHQRVERLKKMGVITGSQITLDMQKLGLDVTVLLGIHLKSTKTLNSVLANLKLFKEITDAYYTTGTYALIIKVQTKSIEDFHKFLIEKLQAIDEIQATESFICLDRPIENTINFI
ncbi:MAG: Lrp/AsnC ligand binding domain-containing protein [Bacteriovoracaceae bacterium]|nr:Lrp/AsnC ligand binding domain-containing protein [Bacteriovoracaceae bacterium]